MDGDGLIGISFWETMLIIHCEGTFDLKLDSSRLTVEEEVEEIMSQLVVHAQ